MDQFGLIPVHMIRFLFFFTWKELLYRHLQLHKLFKYLLKASTCLLTVSLLSPASNTWFISFFVRVTTTSFPRRDVIVFISSVSSAFPLTHIVTRRWIDLIPTEFQLCINIFEPQQQQYPLLLSTCRCAASLFEWEAAAPFFASEQMNEIRSSQTAHTWSTVSLRVSSLFLSTQLLFIFDPWSVWTLNVSAFLVNSRGVEGGSASLTLLRHPQENEKLLYGDKSFNKVVKNCFQPPPLNQTFGVFQCAAAQLPDPYILLLQTTRPRGHDQPKTIRSTIWARS